MKFRLNESHYSFNDILGSIEKVLLNALNMCFNYFLKDGVYREMSMDRMMNDLDKDVAGNKAIGHEKPFEDIHSAVAYFAGAASLCFLEQLQREYKDIFNSEYLNGDYLFDHFADIAEDDPEINDYVFEQLQLIGKQALDDMSDEDYHAGKRDLGMLEDWFDMDVEELLAELDLTDY